MSTPQFQDPYASPRQSVPPYASSRQSVPLYGQRHPGPAHTGKLIAAIVLLVAGPLLGVFIGVVAAVGVAVNILAAGEVIGNGQVVTVNGGDESTVYVPDNRPSGACSVTTADGGLVSYSSSPGMRITINDDRYYSDVRFTAPQSGEYRISCSGLRDGDSVLVGPAVTLDRFVWPFLIGLGTSVTCCWVIAATLLIRRHLARRGAPRPGP